MRHVYTGTTDEVNPGRTESVERVDSVPICVINVARESSRGGGLRSHMRTGL
jgi:organic hydroperoxide reductase OsmC/OhrA